MGLGTLIMLNEQHEEYCFKNWQATLTLLNNSITIHL